MIKAYSADKIFTGQSWKDNNAVIIENDVVLNVVPLIFYARIFLYCNMHQ